MIQWWAFHFLPLDSISPITAIPAPLFSTQVFRPLDALQNDAATAAVFAAAKRWIVEIVREMALFDLPSCPVLDSQARFPASGVYVSEPYIRDAFEVQLRRSGRLRSKQFMFPLDKTTLPVGTWQHR
jgi:hypothetical protein